MRSGWACTPEERRSQGAKSTRRSTDWRGCGLGYTARLSRWSGGRAGELQRWRSWSDDAGRSRRNSLEWVVRGSWCGWYSWDLITGTAVESAAGRIDAASGYTLAVFQKSNRQPRSCPTEMADDKRHGGELVKVVGGTVLARSTLPVPVVSPVVWRRPGDGRCKMDWCKARAGICILDACGCM
jgi:hypothetical protein